MTTWISSPSSAACRRYATTSRPSRNVASRRLREYLKPARLDDALSIGLEVEKLTRVRVIFRQWARRGDDLLVTGNVEIACVNMATMSPAPIPDYLHAKLEALK